MRDINPDPYGPRERSIRNIPISRRSHVPEQTHPESPSPRRRKRRGKKIQVAVVLIVVCVVAGVLLSTLFAGATVTVAVRVETVQAPQTLIAMLDAAGTNLGYKIITATRTATTTVPAAGTKQVSRQASGVVTIENSYSSQSQRLIANTRFEAPDGMIYRIRDSVTVPGTTQGQPGTVMTTIYADSPGESYNRASPTTFTIPGFKGDPRYGAFVARSEGAITGGFVGAEPAVAEADLSKAKAELQQKLDADIQLAAGAAVPEGYVAIPGTLKVSYSAPTQAPAQNNSAAVIESATATGAVIRAADLAASIARAKIPGYSGEALLFDQSSTLDVVATSSTLQAGSLTLHITGTAVLVWQVDQHAIQEALVSKSKSQFQLVLQSFAPAVLCSSQAPCKASIRPFWHSAFPDKPEKIKVILVSGNTQ